MPNADQLLVASVRIGFGALFFAAGVSKLLRARSIRYAVKNYRLLPFVMVPFVAALLGPAEIVSGIVLFASLVLPVAPFDWALSDGLLVTFSVAITAALARGIMVPCDCGPLLNGHVVTAATLRRNVLLLAILTLAVRLQS